MDAGMKAAVRAAGGVRPLSRLLGISHTAVLKMATCPQARLFDMAAKTGLDPIDIRPDLDGWIYGERSRRRMAVAREYHAVIRAAVGKVPAENRSLDDGERDILVALAAARFAAQERGLPLATVMAGRRKVEAGARAWGMALALVVGRARATTIGVMFGTSRQNVDNASERYLRARDGDDPGDFLAGDWPDGRARVIERGRIRKAKIGGSVDFWAAEARFRALIEGEPPAERRRA
jgi:hypothetical protein